MALTAEELTRFRRKIGDTGTTQAFSDDELQDLYTQAGDDFNTAIRDAYIELLGNSWKFRDYTQGESQESKQQIFKNLQDVLGIWEKKVSSAGGSGAQIMIYGMRGMPPREKDE